MQKNVLIYGSCVSRDAFEGLGTEYNLLGYVARQSMISAISKPTALLDGEALASAFQNRSLAGDIKSNLMQTLRRHAAEIDLLVIDLTDERLGLVQLPDGSYVTRSYELVSSGRLDKVEGRTRLINIATERHWTLWESAASRLLNAVSQLGLRGRTLVLNTPWAESTESGESVEDFRGMSTAEINSYFAECCAHIRSMGYTVSTMPGDLRFSAANHKWGAAPYHFGAEGNAWIVDQIHAAAGASD